MTERDERLDDAIDKDDQRIEAGQRQDDEDPTGAHAGRSLLSAFVTNDLTPAFEQLQDRFLRSGSHATGGPHTVRRDSL